MKKFTLSAICFLALLPIGSAGVTTVLFEDADDAGSGGDAPRDHARAVPIATDVVYSGAFQPISWTPDSFFWDFADAYAFEAAEGDTLRMRIHALDASARIFAPDGSQILFDVSTAHVRWGSDPVVAPATGRYVLQISTVVDAPHDYCFSIGRNAPAPAVAAVGTPCGTAPPAAA